MPKRALVFGVTGQDGFYLKKILEQKNYSVLGTSRKSNIKKSVVFVDPACYDSVSDIMKEYMPDEIYNLCGPSSVGLSFGSSKEYITDVIHNAENIISAYAEIVPNAVFVNASSTECFGSVDGIISEDTEFFPISPYAVGKCLVACMVDELAKDHTAINMFLSNHESPLRPARFVTRKIVEGAHAIHKGTKNYLQLGNINISRDWGSAADYMNAARSLAAHRCSGRYIVSSGRTEKLINIVKYAFNYFGIDDYEKYLRTDERMKRRNDIPIVRTDPSKIEKDIGWKATSTLQDVIIEIAASL
jgi:GDPmannose 4,6-dehydratase